MNADDAGAILRSSRGSLDRSSPFFGTTIRFRPPHRRPFSRPFAVANAATTPTSACHANNRRPRRVLARSSRSSRVFVGVRGVGSIGFDRSGSILRSFPRADECRVPRKNESVVKSDGSTSIRDRRFAILVTQYVVVRVTHHRSYYLDSSYYYVVRTQYSYCLCIRLGCLIGRVRDDSSRKRPRMID